MSFAGYEAHHLNQFSRIEEEATKIVENQFGERILIISGGILECLIAIGLASQGKEVTIIESSDEILSDSLTSPKRAEMMSKLEALVVTIFLETSFINKEKEQVCLCNKEGFKTFLNIDNIIFPKKL